LLSAAKVDLPNADKIANEVICLPIYPDLDLNNVKEISDIIKNNS